MRFGDGKDQCELVKYLSEFDLIFSFRSCF